MRRIPILVILVSVFGWALPVMTRGASVPMLGPIARQAEPAVGLRQLVVASPGEALEIRRRILAEEISFHRAAVDYSLDSVSASTGGYLGRLRPGDLRREFQSALQGMAPGRVTDPIPIGDVYFLFQVVSKMETDWLEADRAGVEAIERGDIAGAILHLEHASTLAKDTFGNDDPRLAQSLGVLAEGYRIDRRFSEAEAVYRRALAVVDNAPATSGLFDADRTELLNGLGLALAAQERFDDAGGAFIEAEEIRIAVHGPDSPEVAVIRQNRADLMAFRGDLLGAARIYEEAVGRMEEALGPDDPAAAASRERFAAFRRTLISGIIDRVSRLVALADFQDDAFNALVDETVDLVRLAPLTELGFTQIRSALLHASLSGPTERVLELGLERFPDSRVLRVHLADIYSGTGRTQDALRMLEEASGTPRPDGTDRGADIAQQAVILERIGDMHFALFGYDEAISAYRRLLEIDPASAIGHKKLGITLVTMSRLEEAIDQFELATLDAPDDPSIPLQMAGTLLSMGDADRAIDAADRAIALGTTDPSALFIRARALIVDGQIEEGQAQVQEYQRIDSHLRAEETLKRNIDATKNRALQAFRDGDAEAALGVLDEGLQSYPDAEKLHMTLGIILSRSGRYSEAVDRFEEILADGLGRPFLIHMQLAEWYAALGDESSSRRHREIYEQTRESELVSTLPE